MEALERVARQLGDDCAAAESKLTERQFIEAMRQALACGDFLKHVMVGEGRIVDIPNGTYTYSHKQAVTYEPYREHECLKARIRGLQEENAMLSARIQTLEESLHHYVPVG